jgi:hypothetical protein
MHNIVLGFSEVETWFLLDIINKVLPIRMEEWEEVERQHIALYPQFDQNKEMLKQTFQLLYLKKMPTGDCNCNPNVRLGKELYKAIRQK